LGAQRTKKFLAGHWQIKPFRAPVAPRLRRWLEGELDGLALEALLERFDGRISAWCPRPEGGLADVPAPARQALHFYDAGRTLYIHQATTPAIQAWHRGLARDLGAYERGLTCSLFLTQRGGHTPWHFDNLQNFTIQLRGKKRWRLAQNRALTRPLHNWVPGSAMPSEMRLYSTIEPRAPQKAEQTIELRAGELLYIPRGCWHAVEAARDSISLFVAFTATCWADLVLDSLRSLLIQSPVWRDNLVDPWGRPRARAEARQRLGVLWNELPRLIDRVGVDDVVVAKRRAPGPRARLRRNPLATLALAVDPKERGYLRVTVTLHQGRFERSDTFVVQRAEGTLYRAASEQNELSLDALALRFPGTSRERLAQVLNRLVMTGFLRVEKGRHR
jgi:hypothetical protein